MEKGESYVRDLSTFSMRPAGGGQEYRAAAHGQEAYRVSVTVKDGRIVQTHCSCPVGGEGSRCKHTAALLNQMSSDPSKFVGLPALDALLGVLDLPAMRHAPTGGPDARQGPRTGNPDLRVGEPPSSCR